MTTLLVTGTDTAVGKTVLTTAIAAYWHRYCANLPLGLMKLMQTGIGDRELYHSLFDSFGEIEIVTPLWWQTPVAPPIAAAREGQIVDLALVWRTLTNLQERHDWVVVEALGGLGSPVTEELTVADLAQQWHLDVVLVVSVKLGAIAQTVANVALARQNQLNIKGIVLNCSEPCTNSEIDDLAPIELIQSLTHVPVLGTIPYLTDITDLDKLAQVAANLQLEYLSIGHLNRRIQPKP